MSDGRLNPYYVGGARVAVEGVPIRLARKPSAHNLAGMRSEAAYRTKHGDSVLSTKERAIERAKAANTAIQIYADMLEISLTQAKARISAQRLHVMANPVQDLTQVYDL